MIRNIATAFVALTFSLAIAQQMRLFVQPEGTSVAVPAGYDAQLQFNYDAEIIARQCALPGPPVLAVVGPATAETVARFPATLAAARNCPNIVGLHLYDEYGWSRTGFVPGLHNDEVCAAARATRAAGLFATMTILAEALLRDDFILTCVNDFDGLAFDYYPSIRVAPIDFKGCTVGSNHTVNVAACSARKLRAMGFVGKIGYGYQAFGLTTEPDEVLIHRLIEQRVAIDTAGALGIDLIFPWGLNLGPDQTAREPLRQLSGTLLAPLVTP